jgi:uncharacterized protein (DUF697 family)/tellurite resistance protein
MSESERRGILLIALFSAFADGAKDERERIKEIARSLAGELDIDLPTLLQAVLLKRQTVHDAARMLETPQSKQLAYELAVCVCDADGASNAAERTFLNELRLALDLDAATAQTLQQEADEISELPLVGPAVAAMEAPKPSAEELDKTILNYSVLNGALELLPQSVATMAIIPLQMKMVYRLGKAHGYELDRGHVKDLLATLGVGLTSQYVEEIARKMLGGLLGKLGGGLLRGVGRQGVSSAMAFASTYALGQVAKLYYASGRKLDAASLKQAFQTVLGEGRTLSTKYAEVVASKARTIDVKQLASMVRSQ